jgi:hypothetical protein
MLKSHTGNAEEETPYYEPLIEGFRNLGYGEGRAVLQTTSCRQVSKTLN